MTPHLTGTIENETRMKSSHCVVSMHALVIEYMQRLPNKGAQTHLHHCQHRIHILDRKPHGMARGSVRNLTNKDNSDHAFYTLLAFPLIFGISFLRYTCLQYGHIVLPMYSHLLWNSTNPLTRKTFHNSLYFSVAEKPSDKTLLFPETDQEYKCQQPHQLPFFGCFTGCPFNVGRMLVAYLGKALAGMLAEHHLLVGPTW